MRVQGLKVKEEGAGRCIYGLGAAATATPERGVGTATGSYLYSILATCDR